MGAVVGAGGAPWIYWALTYPTPSGPGRIFHPNPVLFASPHRVFARAGLPPLCFVYFSTIPVIIKGYFHPSERKAPP